jgi:hypothetical protein
MGADDESNADAPRVLRKGGPADVGIRCVHKFTCLAAPAHAPLLRAPPDLHARGYWALYLPERRDLEK